VRGRQREGERERESERENTSKTWGDNAGAIREQCYVSEPIETKCSDFDC